MSASNHGQKFGPIFVVFPPFLILNSTKMSTKPCGSHKFSWEMVAISK